MSEPLFDQFARVREAWSAFVQAVWADRTSLFIALGLTWCALVAVFVARGLLR